MDTPKDLITVTAARKLINVSAHKMAELVREGRINTHDDLLDKRVKLVSKAEVLKLKVRDRAA